MGTRANSLADQFEKAAADLAAAIEGMSDEKWSNAKTEEGWRRKSRTRAGRGGCAAAATATVDSATTAAKKLGPRDVEITTWRSSRRCRVASRPAGQSTPLRSAPPGQALH